MLTRPAFTSLTRLFLFPVAVLFPVTPSFSASISIGPCTEAIDKTGDSWSITIWHPGRYCIGQDLQQSVPVFRLPHQAVPKDPLLIVEKGRVLADLNRHHLATTVPHRVAVRVYGFKNAPISAITIQNGFVSSASGPTVFMVDAFDDGKDTRFGSNLAIASPKGDISSYRRTEFVLENLILSGENHVIVMQGMRNIIRHCKIIGGNGTVNVFGPQLTFEDNEIVLQAKASPKEGYDVPVGLYLEDAADSVVRNNRIEIRGHVTGSQAIVLKNSPNVTISGNTVTGADAVYKLLDEHSAVTATSNTLTP